MNNNLLQQSHFWLLLEKLKTGDYFDYVATLSGCDDIDYQISFFSIFMMFFQKKKINL